MKRHKKVQQVIGCNLKIMDGTFESRLGGAVVGDKSDRSTSTTADGGEEIDGGEEGHDNVVLVVMDVNKAPNLTALNWALTHVIQPGDTVRLLGVLHYIVNPSKSQNFIVSSSYDLLVIRSFDLSNVVFASVISVNLYSTEKSFPGVLLFAFSFCSSIL